MIWIIFIYYSYGWLIMGRSITLKVLQVASEPKTLSFSSSENNISTIYSYPNKNRFYAGHCIIQIRRDQVILNKIKEERSLSASNSFLEDLYEKFPDTFASLPRDVIIISMMRYLKNKHDRPYIEISTLGNTDYAMYEMRGDEFFVVETMVKDRVNFTSQKIYSQIQEGRNVLETRFLLERRTLLVLGCPNFWSAIGAKDITPLLKTSKSITKVLKTLITVACVGYFTHVAENPLTQREAQLRCAEPLVKDIPGALACTFVEIYPNGENPYYHEGQEEASRSNILKRPSDNSNPNGSDHQIIKRNYYTTT